MGVQRFWVAADPGSTLASSEPRAYRRGDANSSGRLDISDALAIFGTLFQGLPLPCPEAAEANADGRLDISDAVLILSYLFLDAPPFMTPALGLCVTLDEGDAADCAAGGCR